MDFSLLQFFQGFEALADSDPKFVLARFFLIAVGFVMIYLGRKGTLEPLLMIPMGLGMATINASVLFMPLTYPSNNFVRDAVIQSEKVADAALGAQGENLRVVLQKDGSYKVVNAPAGAPALGDHDIRVVRQSDGRLAVVVPQFKVLYGFEGGKAIERQIPEGGITSYFDQKGEFLQAKLPDGTIVLYSAADIEKPGLNESKDASFNDAKQLVKPGTLFVDALMEDPAELVNQMQIYFMQPIYTLAFSNGLIACLVFMGIGVLLDVGFVLQRPFQSMIIAIFAELGTVLTVPVAAMLGLDLRESVSVAMVGGADGPMVLYTSLMLCKHLFVPITVVAYLYLGLCYGGYPYLCRLLVPKKLRMLPCISKPAPAIGSGAKLTFAVIACVVLCLLFPVAAPLFLSLFIGVAVREAEIKPFIDLIGGPILYGATFFLGLQLGVLCEASTLMNEKVLMLLILGILALLISGLGGLLGGYFLYFVTGGKFNPVVGIAGVSCLPTNAKVAQKVVSHDAPGVLVLPAALGACVCGVITSAIFCGVYVTIVPALALKWPQ